MRIRFAALVEWMGEKWWSLPLGLLVLDLVTFGVLVPWLGFYWDDWPKIWFLRTLGPLGFWKVYASDRPVLPWIYMISTPVLGTNPLAWQAFGLISRWAGGLSVWWMARSIWPDQRRLAALVAMLTLVYPGFKQGPISVIYSHYFLLFSLMCLSLGLTAIALRHPSRRRGLTALSLLGLGASAFSVEYFAGAELTRPLIIWLGLGDRGLSRGRRLTETARHWLPYALVFGAYLGWRIWGLKFPTYQPMLLDALRANPLAAFADAVGYMAGVLRTAAVSAWADTFRLPAFDVHGKRVLVGYVLTGAAAGVIAWLCLSVADVREPQLRRPTSAAFQAIVIGAAAMIGSGLPIWVTQLPVGLEFPWDRLTLPLMLGAGTVAAGVLAAVTRGRGAMVPGACLVVAMAAGMHFMSQLTYVREGESFQTFLWQLSWRIPGLEKGTTVLTNDIPLLYYSDNSLTAPLNWLYSPENHSLQMDYMLYYPTVRVGLALTRPLADLPIRQAYRAATFEGSTSQLLALFYDPPGCVHVLDVVLDDSMPNLPPSLSAWVPLSRLNLIQTQASIPRTPPLFREEPPPDWCYYFEKADLARQMGDWQAVADLGDQAFAVDHPSDASERLVFIEGYAHTGRWDRAEELSLDALVHNPAVDRMVCHSWDRIVHQVEPGKDGLEAAARVRAQAHCEGG